jgi:hypothetical protein
MSDLATMGSLLRLFDLPFRDGRKVAARRMPGGICLTGSSPAALSLRALPSPAPPLS